MENKIQIAGNGKNRDLDKFNDHVSKDSVMRICNTVKYLDDIEYTNAYEAMAQAIEYQKTGERSVWVVVVPQGETDINLVKNCPYWVFRTRSKKLNTDGTLNTTPKAKTAVSPSKKTLLDKIAELEAKLAGNA
jgi:hypothetical protein